MKKILSIFAVTTGIAKPLMKFTSFLMFMLLLWSMAWLWYDGREVRLRNKIKSQTEIIRLYEQAAKDSLDQKVKLIDLIEEHSNITEVWPGKWFIWQRRLQ